MQKSFYSGTLSAVGSTTYYVDPSQFKSHSGNYAFKPKNYTGPGYTAVRVAPDGNYVGKTTAYPSIPLQAWQTNTALELQNIVYPDGTPKNSSYAQQQLASQQETANARIKLSQLERQYNLYVTQGRLNEAAAIQQEIEQLQHKYFPSEIQTAEIRNANASIGALQGPLRNISISAQGHATAAERQRLAILAELQALVALGRVSGAGAGGAPVPPPPPPPARHGGGGGPRVSPRATPAPPTVTGSPTAPTPSLGGTTPSSSTTLTTPSPATAVAPPTVGVGSSDIDSKTEEIILNQVTRDLSLPSTTYTSIPQFLDDIYTATGKEQKVKLAVAATALETVKGTNEGKQYLLQLALIARGRNPSEINSARAKVNMGSTSTYKGFLRKVDEYLTRL